MYSASFHMQADEGAAEASAAMEQQVQDPLEGVPAGEVALDEAPAAEAGENVAGELAPVSLLQSDCGPVDCSIQFNPDFTTFDLTRLQLRKLCPSSSWMHHGMLACLKCQAHGRKQMSAVCRSRWSRRG